MKKAVSIVFVLLLSLSAFGQSPAGFDMTNYGVRIEPDQRLMAVLATLEMARTTDSGGASVQSINTPLSAQGKEFRELLKSDSAALNDELRERISQFVNQHKRRNAKLSDAEIVAPFISMAYTLSPAPELADPAVTSDLPGNLLDVLDFAPLVREFYRRSSFSGNLSEYQKLYLKAADGSLRLSARDMVSELLTYLHTSPQLVYTERIKTETQRGKSKKTTLQKVETRDRERRFFIVPEMLAPAGNINFLNIRDDYYVIVPPDSDLSNSDVRRAFLQFVADPLVLNNAKDISTVSAGIKALLDEQRKKNSSVSPDVYLSVSRSLVAAIDARQQEYLKTQIATAQARRQLASLPEANVAARTTVTDNLEKFKRSLADETALRLSEDYEKGSVLAFHFADQLKGLEESGFNIAASVREMILTIDTAKEASRLEQAAAARARAIAARSERKANPAPAAAVESPVTSGLREIQSLIAAKNYDAANAGLKQMLAKYPSEPRIHYNLGRAASLSAEAITDPAQQRAKLLEAKTSYENVLRAGTAGSTAGAPDAALTSLSYVAIAKIVEFLGDPAYAMNVYDAAIKIGDVAGGAYGEAIAAKQRLLKNQ